MLYQKRQRKRWKWTHCDQSTLQSGGCRGPPQGGAQGQEGFWRSATGPTGAPTPKTTAVTMGDIGVNIFLNSVCHACQRTDATHRCLKATSGRTPLSCKMRSRHCSQPYALHSVEIKPKQPDTDTCFNSDDKSLPFLVPEGPVLLI